MSRADITLQERHEAELQALLQTDNGSEAAAYLLFGRAEISADPWDRQRRESSAPPLGTRFVLPVSGLEDRRRTYYAMS